MQRKFPADFHDETDYIENMKEADEPEHSHKDETKMAKASATQETVKDLSALGAILETVGDEDILSELDALDVVSEEVEVEASAEAEIPDTLDDAILQDLDMTVQRAAGYAAQTAVGVATKEEAAAVTAGTKKKRVVSAKSGTPSAPRDLSAVGAEFFSKEAGSADAEADKVAMIAARPAQVKIAEKFDQLFCQISVGKPASVYVMKAFELLESKGSLTSAELIAYYKASGLKEGTARSQTGQILELFKITGIATRSGQTLVAIGSSLIADRLRKIAAAKTTAPATV